MRLTRFCAGRGLYKSRKRKAGRIRTNGRKERAENDRRGALTALRGADIIEAEIPAQPENRRKGRNLRMEKQDQVTLLGVQDAAFVKAFGKTWTFDSAFAPRIVLRDGTEIRFDSAASIKRTAYRSGLGEGERVRYAGFEGRGALSFETQTLVNDTTGFVDCTFVPLEMAGLDVKEVLWPAPLVAQEEGAYAVLNTMQGQLLPADWPQAVGEKMPFDGQMGSESAYMPWWGEITPEGGYLCYARHFWDDAYTIDHPAGGPTRVYVRHLPSLGQMRYARTMTYCFVPAGSDYVTLCRLYRKMIDEEGRAHTLREKAAANPNVSKLVGCCVMHVDGKTHRVPECAFYDAEHPETNDHVTPFAKWEKRVRRLKGMGVDQLYLHLDGWGQPGYDNQHTDYLPPCREAGGWPGLKSLSDTMQELGYMFGIHDQYRDYYLDAPTYDPDNAALSADGSLFEMARWAGGRQNYLCASLAQDYVRRNFEQLFAHGIHLEGTYLDVFTCNELDECANPRHPMTRRECIDARCKCLSYLTAHGVCPSSEEVNDWAMGTQVFCHWAPYFGNTAIPVPLFNLVYHDCVIIPWMMGTDEWGIPEGTTGFLNALLCGGMGYMSDSAEGEALEENIRQWRTISELQHHVAMEKMVSHEFLSEDRKIQRTIFGDGTVVTVNFGENTYDIRYPEA